MRDNEVERRGSGLNFEKKVHYTIIDSAFIYGYLEQQYVLEVAVKNCDY